MPRPIRVSEGGSIYHTLNRGNARNTIFEKEGDYQAFLRILGEALTRFPVRLLAYCLMPNHFHLMLWPVGDGDLSRFMQWLTLTHTQRWHAHRGSAGLGHLYQGRFKSFLVQDDDHFLTACRYVERNALRAGLVTRAEDWPWCSLGSPTDGPCLSPWPIDRPEDWIERVNRAMAGPEEDAMRRSIRRSQPFGNPAWQAETMSRFGLESAFRSRGRPRKDQNGT